MEELNKVKINPYTEPGIDIIRIERSSLIELFTTARPDANRNFSSLTFQLARYFRDLDAKVVKMDIFGANVAFSECRNTIKREFGGIDWPITYIDGKSCSVEKVAGIQIYAITGVPVETVTLDGHSIGRVFEDEFAKYCILGNVHSNNVSASAKEQTKGTLENIERGLRSAGMDIRNIVRTWFFNNNILDWYKDFNSVRSHFYRKKSIFNGLVPASTGIGGDNPEHHATVAGATALQAKDATVTTKEIPSPLQCSAQSYGSSFSRAVEVSMPDHRRIFVSGTASIDPNGNTMHIDNVDSQIAHTFKVVDALLKSRKMSYYDVTRVVAYFKYAKDAHFITKYYKKYGLPAARVVVAHDDICRDELLFEIEVDAVSVI